MASIAIGLDVSQHFTICAIVNHVRDLDVSHGAQ